MSEKIEYLLGLDPKDRADLAKRTGVGSDYLYQIGVGYRKASHKVARNLERETNGDVTKQQLRPDIFGKEFN